MNIYVIVVTYNAMKWIDRCLESIFNSDIQLHALVVDNLSTDGTLEHIKSNYTKAIIIESGNNLGFGRANNLAINYALERNADYVFLLNQDAWIESRTISGLVDIHVKNPSFGILSPMHLNGKGDALDFRFSIPCNSKDCPGLISDMYLNRELDVYSITFVNAAFWLVPKSTLLSAGIFDPIFPHYGEDLDYVNRVLSFALKVGISPKYVGYHDREDRKQTYARDRTMRTLGYLCILKNINKRFITCFIEFITLWIRKLVQFSIKLQFKMFFNELFDGVKLLTKIPMLKVNREYCKKTSAFLPKNYV